jgi:NAD(P)-dependent dehydrogenase (short-subunit alcohol dehydrogenase family)
MPVTISDSLAGRRALVTGGSKGTGAAIAGRLAVAGATVMTTARTMPGGYPDPGLFVAADITTPGGAQQVIDRVGERFGVLDILVHTVGGSHGRSGGFAALTDGQWQDELNLNLLGRGPARPGLLPAMIEAGSPTSSAGPDRHLDVAQPRTTRSMGHLQHFGCRWPEQPRARPLCAGLLQPFSARCYEFPVACEGLAAGE